MIDIRIFDLKGYSSVDERDLVKSSSIDKGHHVANIAFENAMEGVAFIEEKFGESYAEQDIQHLYVLINDGASLSRIGFSGRDVDGGQYLRFAPGNPAEFYNLALSPDIMCHELTHLFLKNYYPWLPDGGQTGAIEEHFADVMGICFINRQLSIQGESLPQWILGKSIVRANNGMNRYGIRNLEKPGSAHLNDTQSPSFDKLVANNAYFTTDEYTLMGPLNHLFYQFVTLSQTQMWEEPLSIWCDAFSRLPDGQYPSLFDFVSALENVANQRSFTNEFSQAAINVKSNLIIN